MESNAPQDLAALALQIQTLIANVEELTKQNQEMRLQLQQEDNRDVNRNEDEENSNKRDGSKMVQEKRIRWTGPATIS